MKKGAYSLIITPFKKDMSLDETGLRKLVKMQVDAGIHGIAPLGVTGENTLLKDVEIQKVVEIIVSEAKGKAKIVPDTCTSSLWKAKERVQMFADLGADYISVFAPFFVIPKPEGVIDFYEKLADFSKIPIVLHNAQARTGIDMIPATTAHLAKHPNIIGIKDGNKKLDHLAKVLYLTKDDDFIIIVKDNPNDTLIKLMSDIWNDEKIYFTIYNLHNYLYNILEHECVPQHIHIDEQEVEDVKKKYNIMSDSQWPEISRFDPVAQAIGLRPKDVCKIIRSSETAITSTYYRICV